MKPVDGSRPVCACGPFSALSVEPLNETILARNIFSRREPFSALSVEPLNETRTLPAGGGRHVPFSALSVEPLNETSHTRFKNPPGLHFQCSLC